jgi:hypothetical protein
MRAILAFCALFLSACATVPSDAPPYTRAADPPNGQNNVYIYRLGAYPYLRSPMIRINGADILSAPERSYTVIALPYGEHQVQVDWASDTGWPDLKFPIKVTEGEPLFLKVSGSYSGGGTVAGSMVLAVEPEHAENELRQCCRYMSPRPRN